MKKAFSLLLAGVMCVGLLAGCGGQNSESQSSTSSTSSHRQQHKYHSDF